MAARMHEDLSSDWLPSTTNEIHLVNKLDKNLLKEEEGRKKEGEEEGTTRGKERNEGGQ